MPSDVICKDFSLGYVRIINTPTILFMIFSDFFMLYQIFFSPEVKTYKYDIHMLANKSLNNSAITSHFFSFAIFSSLKARFRYTPIGTFSPHKKFPYPLDPAGCSATPLPKNPATPPNRPPLAINMQHYQKSLQICY